VEEKFFRPYIRPLQLFIWITVTVRPSVTAVFLLSHHHPPQSALVFCDLQAVHQCYACLAWRVWASCLRMIGWCQDRKGQAHLCTCLCSSFRFWLSWSPSVSTWWNQLVTAETKANLLGSKFVECKCLGQLTVHGAAKVPTSTLYSEGIGITR
jgi:hypothetical protein